MTPLDELIARGKRVPAHAPWPRVVVDAATWTAATDALAAGTLTLSGLWGDDAAVHIALLDETAPSLAVLTLRCTDGRFPSVGARHAPAIRLERAVADLWGLIADGLPDSRPWLDHGRFPRQPPHAPVARAVAGSYRFLPAEGESLHEIPVGPVHAGIIEPGHFRFTASGETVVRLEERLGYVHKGVESLLEGATLEHGARLAGRVSGDSTVAYAIAYARAAEAACGVEAPPRASWLRAAMAELERIANHLGDFGAICNDAAFALMHAECGWLREQSLRAAQTCFGHRLMRDCVIPGGVATDLGDGGAACIVSLADRIAERLPILIQLYDDTASLQDRTVGTGRVDPALVCRFGAGGFVGRAAGRAFDARRAFPAAPYDSLSFEAPLFDASDVNARVWVRLREIEQSIGLLRRVVAGMPDGSCAAPVPVRAGGEGIALVEGFRGDILVALRIGDGGRLARCHLRDPSWFQWPLLEAAIEGNIVADFPLCNKSFNCSYSGHDL